MSLSVNDSLSHANSENYVTKHVHFNWVIDFVSEIIQGSATFNLVNITKNNTNLKLDCKHLDVSEVLVQDIKVCFDLIEDTIDVLGKCLSIPITSVADELTVTVKYSTTKNGSALQWLKPSATKGKQHPYLFSQCQAIHARSLFPCQDTPSVKFTYSAEVRAVSDLNVLMSAIKSDTITVEGSNKVHRFEQKVPIPSYLVAIACGNLEGRKIGPRSTVWSEPEMVDEAAKEFEDTEQFIVTGEELCGPYVWGIYDVLVLPPSFPYGGMENPCVTFVTSTLLVGDKSLAFVIAHEIAHSWTGNLVTNNTWDDFWLNEGHTMYLENLIMERYFKSEPMRHLLIQTGLAALKDSLNFYGRDNLFNQLMPELKESDPDDAWSIVPYEKGQNLLIHLESICGKDKMLRWLKEYLKKFQYKSVITEQWKSFLFEYMTEVEGVQRSRLEGVDWNEWLYGRWDIPVQPELNTQFGDASTMLAKKWTESPTKEIEHELLSEYEAMTVHQQYYMLQVLTDVWEVCLSADSLKLMGQLYKLTESTNSEVLCSWSVLCIRASYSPAIDQIFTFLNSQGRLKYNKPIYKALNDWTEMRQRAIENFQSMRGQMHPTTAKAVCGILQVS